MITEMMRASLKFVVGIVAVACFSLTGCSDGGPEMSKVEGVVLLDGEPLPEAMVTFEPSRGRSSAGRTDAEGKFTLQYSSTREGAVVGEHVVRISTYEPQRLMGPGEGLTPLKPELVPTKYNSQTELKRTVEPTWGPNEFVFELDPIPEKKKR